MSKPYSVVILSKNRVNLEACLFSIARLNPGCPVIVVDDGLEFSASEAFRFGWNYAGTSRMSLSVVPGVKPFCFSRNANTGIAAAGESDIILLNDDATLETENGFDLLALVARHGDRAEEYGIISPATSGVGNENQSLYAGWTGEPRPFVLREEPKVLCFVCVYIRREVLNKLGPLDERFIAYGWDDNDYCQRAIADGYKLGIYDPVQVEHGTLKSTFRGHGHCDMTFNQRLYEEKWGLGVNRRSPVAPGSE